MQLEITIDGVPARDIVTRMIAQGLISYPKNHLTEKQIKQIYDKDRRDKFFARRRAAIAKTEIAA